MASIDLALPRRRSLAGRIPVPSLALPILVLGGGVLIGALGLFAAIPNTFADEAIYVELGRHLGASGKFEILGVSFPALTYGPAGHGHVVSIGSQPRKRPFRPKHPR